ncbi:hypothetical protein [Ectopseudomonas khazarica]|uniref:hypothetical protein n=1 Tax=Ectopseudomonas khazarica TaxID=2502979 RepID=UPI0037C8E8D9
MGRREELGRAAEDDDGKARGIRKTGVTAGARHSTPFFAKVKSRQAIVSGDSASPATQSTEPVDNSVNNLGESAVRPDAMGAPVKLTIFSPMKKCIFFIDLKINHEKSNV